MDDAQLRQELARCHTDAFAWAMHCCRDRERAVEALQAAYLKVLDGRARFEGRSSFRTWLFAVIRRTAAGEWRRFRFVSLVELPSAAPAADERMESEERTEELARALGRLSARQREVLMLVFYHECTIEEAAEVMGIGLGSARTHYARGKDQLRQLLRESWKTTPI